MSLVEIIRNAESVLEKIKDLKRQQRKERDDIAKSEESISGANYSKWQEWQEICNRHRSEMDPLRKSVISSLTSVLQIPEGVKLEEIKVYEGSKSKGGSSYEEYPANIKLMFSLDDAITQRISFNQVYARAYQLKDEVPTLNYYAHVTYDARQFLADTYFDPRAFNDIKMSKSGTTFMTEPFFTRDESTGNLVVKYYASKKEMQVLELQASVVGRKKVWGPILKDIAKQFDGRMEVSLEELDYAEMVKGKSFFKRAKTYLTFLSILQRKKSNWKATKAMAAAIGFQLKGRQSWTRYEGIISVDELAKLEQVLGTEINNYVRSVNILTDVNDNHSEVKDKLRRLVSYVSKVEVPGTSPENFRISREQANDFLQQDLSKMYELAGEVTPNSYFHYRNTECTEYEQLHLPLLRKLSRLSSLDLERLFPNHSWNSKEEPDEYSPNFVDEVVEELRRVNIFDTIQHEVVGKLQDRKSEYKKNGYLTIHELYNLQLEAISQLQRENPKELLERYLGLYKDTSASPLSITGLVGNSASAYEYEKEPVLFYHPIIMNFDGKVEKLTFTDGTGKHLSENNLDFSSRDGKHTLHLRIIPENPCLLPLQQYSLELLGVQVINGTAETK